MSLGGTQVLIRTSLLSVIAFLIMLWEFPLPMFPVFLKLDLSDIAAALAVFSISPWAGVWVEFLKNILHLLVIGTTTGYIGELANFILGSIFALTLGFIYRAKYNRRVTVVLGMIGATLAMSLAAGFLNYYFFIPLYEKILGLNLNNLITMSGLANKLITDLKSLIIYAIVPFNLIKGLAVSLLAFFLYKRINFVLEK